MIYKGRNNNLYLYEVTEQDLLVPSELSQQYKAGNVLVFSSKKQVELGQELIRADDMEAAYEFLENSDGYLYESVKSMQKRIADLEHRIVLRDNLLGELNDDLLSQQETNGVLIAFLKKAQSQLKAGELSRNELVDDLQQVSAETHTIGIALERSLEEKEQLQAELAKLITDLLDLNCQNDDLKRQLSELRTIGEGDGPQKGPEPTSNVQEMPVPHDNMLSKAAVPQLGTCELAVEPYSRERAQMVTMTSGKQVHVFHEFGTPPRRSARSWASLTVRMLLRAALITTAVMVTFVLLSVFATAQLNGISIGEALDKLALLLKL
ncbi:MAG: hypothetical protein LBD25_08320 [Coriobacteriales bacterium]|jgi:uncharacterized coiled-coil protein SlyX|nr:hypothetical protein [Coriobacteriales bacterium]